jgi:acylphosphatase
MHVADTARQLELVGWVANEAGGTVRCVAEGPREDLERLVAALRAGPRGAVVEWVDESFGAPTNGFRRFEIRSGSHSGD